MQAIKGIYKAGQVILGQPADWPDGTELLVAPVARANSVGVREDDWPTDAEGINRHLALMDRIEPLDMTPEEEATWQAARAAQKNFERATWDRGGKQVEGLFE